MKTISAFEDLTKELETLKQENLYREIRYLDDIRATHAKVEGREVTLFCGNDYLGLSKHPLLRQAFQEASEKFGVGSGAARLISGSSILVKTLEERLAKFKRKERALIFTTGYLANLGTVSALCGKDDLVVIDKLSHASIIDASKLSGASVRIFPHRDMVYLEKILKTSNKYRRTLIITDSVFSMDGDFAPLREMVVLKEKYEVLLMIDEAHGTGVFGERGSGVAEQLGVEEDIDISIGTMSKAFGTLGGFVAGNSKLIDYLINKSRTFIFSTALPSAVIAATLKALDIIESQPELRQKLEANVKHMRDGVRSLGFEIEGSASPIIPIVLGDEDKTLEVSKRLFKKGFWVPAIRYPTVPKKRARLRISASAVHTSEEIDSLLEALKQLF